METAVEIKNLKVKLDGQLILDDISIELTAGKIIGLLGPSGAGKTTLMRVLVGRQSYKSGSVEIFGLAAGGKNLRAEIGYMTQSPAVYPDINVYENIRYFATMRGLGKRETNEVIEQVRLRPNAKQLVSKLSGGEKSRVSLAVALLGKPKLLVLDEPTVGVDPVLRRDLWKLFTEIAGQGSTLIVSSHVMDEASHCQELVLLRNGKVLANGSPSELCKRTGSKNVEESFLKLVEDHK